MIWFRKYTLEEVNTIFEKNMTAYLGIKATAITENEIVASMPITDKVRQPFGLLHGGASVVLAESIGSIASALVVDLEKSMIVGMEINANHVRAVKEGEVFATCSPLHIGVSSHVWEIKIRNEQEKLVCVSRLTVAVLKQRDKKGDSKA